MRPVSKAVKLIVAVGPVDIRLTFVLCRAVPPATATSVTYYAHHITITSLQFGVVIHVWHYKRGEDTVFLSRLGDISQGTSITLTTISTSYDTYAAVFAVLIPREEVHTDEIHPEVLIMLEETVDIFPASGILSYCPMKPLVFRTGILHCSLTIII